MGVVANLYGAERCHFVFTYAMVVSSPPAKFTPVNLDLFRTRVRSPFMFLSVCSVISDPVEITRNRFTSSNASITPISRLMTDNQVNQLSKVIKALTEPNRLRIIYLLSQHGELTTTAIQLILQIPENSVSIKMMKLAGLNIVKGRRDRREIYYSLTDPHAIPLGLILQLNHRLSVNSAPKSE